ncbi:DUF1800 domain-containing protein [Flexibacterium corallicola]|uniref:DUF1800 domain-containing protein n=1 Tax=Flexibacterium corallicola TaxID=3037259 RepID=UPI00286ECD31|nr:DUF1800 domain-containing protein [Pseudovibrio sp. M1P-2-3]
MATDFNAFLAAKRFGLGATPYEISSYARDPQGSLLQQLARPKDALISPHQLLNNAEALKAFYAYRRKRDTFDKTIILTGKERSKALRERLGQPPREFTYKREVEARIFHASQTRSPFLERLVMFWSNHLCISVGKGQTVTTLAGPYERDVIRPNILGRFEDMLLASIQHPAMLNYLDNNRSIGPNSNYGRKSQRGLNENLAREILELHTLGVNGGYTQADIIAFAKTLSGWTYYSAKDKKSGQFRFLKTRHEPGPKIVLNKTYPPSGKKQAIAILKDLAKHPSTARFLSKKLVTYFLGEDPDEDLVSHLSSVYLSSNGNLMALTQAMITSAKMWAGLPHAFISPYEFLIATNRATGHVPNIKESVRMLRILGEETWSPPSPAGWPVGPNVWLAPDALLERIDWATRISRSIRIPKNILAHSNKILEPALSSQTRRTISRAESRQQAHALLLLSPEFQRR